ncbi:MAG: hypothetical protein ABR590_06720 [Spirochaetia bacterium]
MKISIVFALLLLPLTAPAQQQSTQLVFAFVGVSSLDEEISGAEIRVLENRLTTALVGIAESQGYSIIIPRNRDLIRNQIGSVNSAGQLQTGAGLAELVAAHGVVAGEIHVIEEQYFLDLQVISTTSSDTLFAYSAEFETYLAALDGGRNAMYALFDLEIRETYESSIAERESDAVPTDHSQDTLFYEDPSASLVVGRWSGDVGIDHVELFPDGQGVARIPGGHTMRLRFETQEDQVVVFQDEPNAPKLYLGSFPYNLAVQIVELARPMRWIFRLSRDGMQLIGNKETTSVRVERSQIVGADNSYSRPAAWERLP